MLDISRAKKYQMKKINYTGLNKGHHSFLAKNT